MASLVNRWCWMTARGLLQHGKIVEQRFEPNICRVLLDEPFAGEECWSPTSNLHLTHEEVISACEDAVDYWQRKAERLRAERDQAESKLPQWTAEEKR
jgi:hypothetical protein